MASIITRKNGTRALAFFLDDERKWIALGAVNRKQAESVKSYVEDLVACRLTGCAPRNSTAEWLADLPREFHEKLEGAGLVKEREQVHVPTLAAWVDAYIAGRKDVRPQTRVNYWRAREDIVKYFGADRPLDRITGGECEAFRVWLKTDRNLAEGTTRRMCKRCKQFFAAAIRRDFLKKNPFDGIQCSNYSAARFHFVSRADAMAVLAACPDVQWRLIFGLARWGGLRVPSEIMALRWDDVHWDTGKFTVRSPKTEHHDGKGARDVPIFPELEPLFRDAFEAATDGAEFVIGPRYRQKNNSANLRTQLVRIVEKAGVKVWPKVFQNLRSTRETELAETWPIQVICAWIGNSPAVASKHYLQVTAEHFSKARHVATHEAKTGLPENQGDGGRGHGSTAGASGAHQNAHHSAHQDAHRTIAAGSGTDSHQAEGDERNSMQGDGIRCHGLKKEGQCRSTGRSIGDPNGTRTRVTALKGLCPNRWTMGPRLL